MQRQGATGWAATGPDWYACKPPHAFTCSRSPAQPGPLTWRPRHARRRSPQAPGRPRGRPAAGSHDDGPTPPRRAQRSARNSSGGLARRAACRPWRGPRRWPGAGRAGQREGRDSERAGPPRTFKPSASFKLGAGAVAPDRASRPKRDFIVPTRRNQGMQRCPQAAVVPAHRGLQGAWRRRQSCACTASSQADPLHPGGLSCPPSLTLRCSRPPLSRTTPASHSKKSQRRFGAQKHA